LSDHTRLSGRGRLLALVGGSVVALLVVTVVVLAASGSRGAGAKLVLPTRDGPPLQSIFEADVQLVGNPAATLDQLRRLGVDTVRLYVPWGALDGRPPIAPDPTSRTPPAGFDATNPASYPATGWAPYDTVIRDAAARGIAVDFTLAPPPPLWAAGSGAPNPSQHPYWEPSAADFGQFVSAVGTRYSGHYTPPGATTPLPRVSFWAIWNEPNLGIDLAPQAIDNSAVEVSPRSYRALVGAAWNALQATGHASDTILIGELAPAGESAPPYPGNFANMVPLRFLRALYCVDSSYTPLQGAAAAARGCPTTSAGSAQFARDNPALFHASGIADHPYSQGLAPDVSTPDEPDYAELANLPELEQSLDRLQRAYGSSTQFPIYSTEFGYQTRPPDLERGVVTPAQAALYLNWAEYISWRDPRMRSYDQYLLVDGLSGVFASALEYPTGTPKPGYYAYRMPLFLPTASASAGQSLEVWGCVRPARYARLDSGRTQRARLQFQPAGGRSWTTVRTIALADPYGYFDVAQAFPSSGHVRVAWSYPHGPEIYSRTVDVEVH
jgi:hypothetical protein